AARARPAALANVSFLVSTPARARDIVTLHPADVAVQLRTLVVKLFVSSWAGAFALGIGAAAGAALTWAFTLVVFLVGWLYITWMVQRRLVIGRDGVVIRGVDFHRFVSYGRIEHVETHERGVTLRLRAGDTV